MRAVHAFALTFLPFLTACADRAPDSALASRVARLEREVASLRAEVRRLRDGGAERVTDVAAANACALDLAQSLEGYRTDNDRYPAPADVIMPSSCADLRVEWRQLTPRAYAFDVSDTSGRVLTRQVSQ